MKNSTITKKKYIQYIIEAFDCDSMEISEKASGKEKAQKFLSLIEGRHTDYQLSNTKEHIQGLGEYIELEYTNFEILNIAKEFGLIDNMMSNKKYSAYKNQELALEKVEEQITANYWDVVANYIIQIAR